MSTDHKAPRYAVFFSPLLLLLLRLKHSPQHPVLSTALSHRSSLKVRDQFSNPYTTTRGAPSRRGFGGVQTPPPPEIPKVHQNRAKLNPIVKTAKNCRI